MKPWHVGGLELEYPIIVGAGVCKTPESVLPYQNANLPIGAVVTGSYTPLPRAGNTGRLEFWHPTEEWGLNAFGMPNCGYLEAVERIPKLGLSLYRPLILSVAGFAPEEYVGGYMHFSSVPIVAAVELNFGCPNVHEGKTLPMSYDLSSLSRTFRGIKLLNIRTPIWVKLSPYLYAEDVRRLSQHVDVRDMPYVDLTFVGSALSLLARHAHIVRGVVISNTIPNCRYRGPDGEYVTTPNDGQAGLSGSLLKPIVLRQVREFRRSLPTSIDVIVSGGVLTGDDAMEYFNEDVASVQCTSLPYFCGGPKAFPPLVSGSEAFQEFLSTHL